jgi:dienelactone hydrolase
VRKVVDAAGKPIHLMQPSVSLSHDGARVLVMQPAPVVPQAWERYRPVDDYPGLQIVADQPGQPIEESIYRPQLYAVVDLATGSLRPLTDAPNDIDMQLRDVTSAWAADGRVAVLGAYPPLASVKGNAARILPCALAVVSPANAGFQCLESTPGRELGGPRHAERPQVVQIVWPADGHTLLTRSATPAAPDHVTTTSYVERDGTWHRVGTVASKSELRLSIRESIDERPVLVGSVGARASRDLLDPNPQLRDVAMGTAIPYSWRDDDGDLWTGALVRPPSYDAKRRYPLVVQTHGLDKSRYLVDGPSPTGYAARAFAAKDMLVLQVQEIGKGDGTYRESPLGAAGYRAAIRQLAREGHIDTAKVGIIGWSHYGPYVLQGLVDEPSTYAAATFAEASFNAYSEYLINIDYMGAARERMSRAQVGPKPFGAGLPTWLERSAGFKTDRVCAPVLWQANGPAALVYGWDSYAALRAQNKPVDFLYIRNGHHVLVKPQERLIEQGMNVDWYDYWLNDHRDSHPAKAAQYARWDRMRAGPRCGDAGNTPAAARDTAAAGH